MKDRFIDGTRKRPQAEATFFGDGRHFFGLTKDEPIDGTERCTESFNLLQDIHLNEPKLVHGQYWRQVIGKND